MAYYTSGVAYAGGDKGYHSICFCTFLSGLHAWCEPNGKTNRLKKCFILSRINRIIDT